MHYAYYPGCSAEGTGVAYNISLSYVTSRLGIELDEIPDWNCCGATAGHVTSHDLAISLAARNLALAEPMGLDVAVPCAACYSRLKIAQHFVSQNKANQEKVEEIIEMPYAGKYQVKNMLEIMDDDAIYARLAKRLYQPLNHWKVACYYGCLLVRPVEITQFDDSENPMSMDRLMHAIGAQPIDWAFKTECCGASNQVCNPKDSRPLIYNILRNAAACGAEAIVTACPLCMMNLDMRQKEINKAYHTDFHMPVYFFTQLMGVALGATPEEMAMDKHFFPALEPIKAVLAQPAQEG